MAPETREVEDNEDEEEVAGDDPNRPWSDFLGPECVIKRMGADQKILGNANPEEMQREVMARAEAQKRMGACAEYVKDMSREEKLQWALEVKAEANQLYQANKFHEAAKMYNDCLVAMDLEGTAEQNAEVATKLQLPVCTNLAACMIETGSYRRCIEICNIALSVEPNSAKALYRRGLAFYRLNDFLSARPDFEEALKSLSEQLESKPLEASLLDLEKRIVVYLNHIRRFRQKEKAACQRMFDAPLYADRPDAPAPGEVVDDSDEAIDAALGNLQGSWWCCSRRKAVQPKDKTA